MDITTTFRHMESSKPLREYAEKKILSLSKFNEKVQRSNVVLSVEKLDHLAEVRMVVNGTVLTAKESSQDMYASIDLLYENLKRRLKKHREKESDRHVGPSPSIEPSGIDDAEGAFAESRLEREEFSVRPIFPDDAIMQVESQNRDFFVFLNAENQRINVVYKKQEGTYSLIDPRI